MQHSDLFTQTPRIIELIDPVKIVGLSVDTRTRRAGWDGFWLRRAFRKIDQAGGIAKKKDPQRLFAVSKDFDPDTRAFTYIFGVEVSALDSVTTGCIGFEIPMHTYAVFTVHPRHGFNWGPAITLAKRHAYLRWLPTSEYEAAGGIDDFELHDERSRRRGGPEIDLYIAVKRRHRTTRPQQNRAE